MDTASYSKIRPKRGTKTEWETINPILLEGEIGVEYPNTGVGTGLGKQKMGDGVRHWNDLPYLSDGAEATCIHGGTVTVHHDIYHRSGTTAEWESENPVLGLGEIVYDTDKKAIKIGDGTHKFNQINYIGYNWEMDEDYDFGDIDLGEDQPGDDDQDYDFGEIEYDF